MSSFPLVSKKCISSFVDDVTITSISLASAEVRIPMGTPISLKPQLIIKCNFLCLAFRLVDVWSVLYLVCSIFRFAFRLRLLLILLLLLLLSIMMISLGCLFRQEFGILVPCLSVMN